MKRLILAVAASGALALAVPAVAAAAAPAPAPGMLYHADGNMLYHTAQFDLLYHT